MRPSTTQIEEYETGLTGEPDKGESAPPASQRPSAPPTPIIHTSNTTTMQPLYTYEQKRLLDQMNMAAEYHNFNPTRETYRAFQKAEAAFEDYERALHNQGRRPDELVVASKVSRFMGFFLLFLSVVFFILRYIL